MNAGKREGRNYAQKTGKGKMEHSRGRATLKSICKQGASQEKEGRPAGERI